MRLTFENFIKVIDPEILSRGKSYYTTGHVHDLQEVEDGLWEAEVIGTESYQVEVSEENGALETSCDCPYEWGEHCKHVAAVLYAIQAQRSQVKPARKAKKKSQETLQDVLKNLTHEQLVAIVLDQVRKDKSLGNQIVLRYGKEEPDKALYIRSVQDALKKGVGRDRYIDYRGAMVAARGVNGILEEARSFIADSKYDRTLNIIQAVLETVPNVLNDADDSSGELSGTISYAFEVLADLTRAIPQDKRRDILNYCIAGGTKWRYQGMDYDSEFFGIAADMVANDEEREILFAVLDQYISPPKLGRASRQSQDFVSKYRQETFIEIRLSVMERMGDSPEDIFAYLQEHLRLDRIRQHVIQIHIKQKNYAEAQTLCEDGIKQAETSGFPGLIQQYKIILLEIARLGHKPDTVIPLAEELFLSTHQFEYYDLLKQHIASAEWLNYVQKLIQKAQASRFFWNASDVLGEIYVREGMWQRLLALAQQKGIQIILHFKEHLYQRYPNEVCAVYEKAVFDMLKSTTGRNTYQTAADLLREMIHLGQRDKVMTIIELLKAEYPNRRAMREELDKV